MSGHASAIHYWELAARKVNPETDPERFHELQRGYMQALRDSWAAGKLSASDACDHDKRRNIPASTASIQLPGNGSKAWQSMARRVGVQLSLIEEAPARVELARMGAEIIRYTSKYKGHDLADAVLLESRNGFGQYDTTFDRAIDHLRAICRRARELGFWPADTSTETKQAA